MKRNIIYIILAVLIPLFGCSNGSNKKIFKRKKGDIVLIFKNIPINYKYYHKENSGRYAVVGGNHELMYMQHRIIPTYFYPNHSKMRDTFVIESISEPVEILHKYKGLDNLSIIAQANDTLYFTYKDKMPIIRCSREHKKHDFDYEKLIREKIYKGPYSAYLKYNSQYFRYTNIYKVLCSKGEEQKKFIKNGELKVAKYYHQSIVQLNNELILIDSLISNNLISKNVANFYQERIKYRRYHIKNRKNKTFNIQHFNQIDSLICYSFYRKIINAIYYNSIYQEAKVSQKTYNKDLLRLYEIVQKNQNISKKTKEYLSFKCFIKITEFCTQLEIKEYFYKYKNSYGKNDNIIKYIKQNIDLGNEISDDILLETQSGKTFSFSEIKKKNKGKIIYVDFWASWCAPCKKCISASHILREKYNSKNVVFVYLAYNDNLNRWKQSIKELNLNHYKHSYFIKNAKTSELINSLEIGSIPRFILYGSDGKLLYKNAPRPNTKDIRSILNKLLTK